MDCDGKDEKKRRKSNNNNTKDKTNLYNAKLIKYLIPDELDQLAAVRLDEVRVRIDSVAECFAWGDE
jgi:hypothetical protein